MEVANDKGSGGVRVNEQHLEVLEHYDGEVTEVRRGRGAWISDGERGFQLIKEYKGTLKRLEFEEQVLDTLIELGIWNVDQYARNREDELLTPVSDGTKYIVKQWFLERECNLKERNEVIRAVAGIAKLHQAFRKIPWSQEWNLGSMQSNPLEQEMIRHTKEMKRTRTYIRNKQKKNEFELYVMRYFDEFYQQALQAQDGIQKLRETGGLKNQYLCHGDLNQHHILMGKQVTFIEFNQMHLGWQMTDLYHFMRKVMEKQNWDEEVGISMVESYHRIMPLTTEDRICLYYLFLYPEKFWKQLNYYINANKAWIPEKNIEKIKKIQQQETTRLQFLSRVQLSF